MRDPNNGRWAQWGAMKMPSWISSKTRAAAAAAILFALTACSETLPIACDDTASAALVRRAFLDVRRPEWQLLKTGGPVDYSAGDGKTPAALARAFANVQPMQIQVSDQRTISDGQGLAGKTAGRYRVCGATVAIRSIGLKEDVKVLVYVASDERLRAELQSVN